MSERAVISFIIVHSFLFCKAQQTTTDGCFKFYPNSKLECGKVIERRTGIGLEHCKSLCVRNLLCAGVGFRDSIQQCDLFERADKAEDARDRNFNPTFSGSYCENHGPALYSNVNYKFFLSTYRCYSEAATQPTTVATLPPTLPPTTVTVPVTLPPTTTEPTTNPPTTTPTTTSTSTTSPTTTGPTTTTTTATSTTTTTTLLLTTTTTINVTQSSTNCSAGFSPVFLLYSELEMVGNDDVQFPASSPSICTNACKKNLTPTGVSAPCASVEFNSAAGTCSISSSMLQPRGVGVSRMNGFSVYFEKICVPDAVVALCPGPYNIEPQHLLSGFDRVTRAATSLLDCVRQCVNTAKTLGFVCTSGVYASTSPTENCILNSENRTTKPEAFVSVKGNDKTDYFELGCTLSTVFPPTDATKIVTAGFNGDPSGAVTRQSVFLGVSNWNEWTDCDRRFNKRIRFKNCKSDAPESCESREEMPCGSNSTTETVPIGPVGIPQLPATNSASGAACQPVLTSDGAVNCALPGTLSAPAGKTVKCVPDICSDDRN